MQHVRKSVNRDDDNDDDGEDDMPGVECVLLSNEHPLVAVSGGADGDIVIWDIERGGGAERARIAGAHSGCVTRLKWSRPSCFVSTGVDGAVREWDCRTASCLSERLGHADAILDAAVCPQIGAYPGQQSHAIATTASDDHTVRVFLFSS